jgi:hypothetical protein
VTLTLLACGMFPLIRATLSWDLPWRVLIGVVGTALLGLQLGRPLPLGVRLLDTAEPMAVTWAWATNGAASVVGSCLAMVCLVFGGSAWTLLGGALCYLLAAASAPEAGSP